ncbi:MAG: glycoside hydrolase superfamily [Monoraphidium minutum]|nr:MAG: glycoside hydrolase superfamily [Monoraphidium minutum]
MRPISQGRRARPGLASETRSQLLRPAPWHARRPGQSTMSRFSRDQDPPCSIDEQGGGAKHRASGADAFADFSSSARDDPARAAWSAAVALEAWREGAAAAAAEPRAEEGVPVFVMLPLDTVNADGVFRYAAAPWFSRALQDLANSGVHGVAVDVWWSATERSPRCYSWGGYRQLLEVLRPTGLKLQAVLSFHACGGNCNDVAQIPLPAWVLQAGQQDPDIFFTDRPRGGAGLGQRNREYLSLWADDAPVLQGRTPMQCYEEFMHAFADAFAADLGGLVEEVVVGMGPCGELRYPAYPEACGWRFPGVGEFQCYDRRALASLAAAAAAAGRPEWGYGGPHDAGCYNSAPDDTGFFAPGGSWGSDYGEFFLSWYSGALLGHGERLLAAASRALGRFQRRPPRGGGPAALLRRLQALVGGAGGGGGGLPPEGAGAGPAAAAAAGELGAPPAGDGRLSEPEPGFQEAAAAAAAAEQEAEQLRLQERARSYSSFVASVFGALSAPGGAPPPPPAPGAQLQLDSWGSGGSAAAACDGGGGGALGGLMARMGLGGSGSLTAAGPRDSSSSGLSGATASTSAAWAPGSGAGGGALAAAARLGSVVSLDSLTSAAAPPPAADDTPPPPLRSCSPPPPAPRALARGGAGRGGTGALAGLPCGSSSTLADSVDAWPPSAAPTPRGGHSPRRGAPGAAAPPPWGGGGAAGAPHEAEAEQWQRQQQGVWEQLFAGAGAAGAGALQLLAGAAAAAARGLGRGGPGLALTVKIAGVHWWYHAPSHAGELTAGYYNAGGRDGYAPLLEMCARYGASATLTCVEMSDEQHPRDARCGPEGLLRQVRAAAAARGVPLGGENALRVFAACGGVDSAALDRIAGNARPPGCGGCGGALRTVASWPAAPPLSHAHAPAAARPGGGAGAGGAAAPAPQAGGGGWGSDPGGADGGGWQGGAAGAGAGYGDGGHTFSAGRSSNAALAALSELLAPSGGLAPAWGAPPPEPRRAAGAPGVPRPPQGGGCGGGCDGGGAPLPAMRSFTFLRLGPELLGHTGLWLQFMCKMAGRA